MGLGCYVLGIIVVQWKLTETEVTFSVGKYFIQCEHLIASFTYEVPVKAWYLFV